MQRLFIINILLAFLWPVFHGELTLGGLFFGFLSGAVLLTLTEYHYGRMIVRSVLFFFYVLYQILRSNINLAWLVIKVVFRPKTVLKPAIKEIPLDISADFDKTLLASIITLTPGTISVDLGYNEMGQEVLYVHGINVLDPDSFAQSIKDAFERPILAIRQDALSISNER